MRKIAALIFAVVLSACFCIFASAADDTEKQAIQIVDVTGNTVGAYEFDPSAEGFDARTVIQRAISKARSAATEENPLTLIIPKGEYTIASSINAYSFITLDFSGSTLTRKEGCGSYLRFGASAAETSGYDGYKSITIKNAIMDDKNIEQVSSFVRFAHAQNITIENVTMKNSSGVTHLLTFAAAKNVTVKNCRFYNMDVSKINASQNCEAIQIDILKESYFDKYSLYDGTPTSDVTVTGCKFKNVPRGCGTHSAIAGHYFKNITFTKNTFEKIPGYAIKTTNYRNGRITNNTIKDCGSGIFVSDITSSNLQNCYAPFSEDTVLEPESKMKISGNKITVCDTSYNSRAYAYGIEVFGAVIKNATDKEGKKYSGDFRMRNIAISNNTIASSVTKKAFHAININGAYSKTKGNKSPVSVTGNSFLYTAKKGSKQTVNMIRLQNSNNVYLSKNSTAEKSKKLSYFVLAENCKGTLIDKNNCKTVCENGILLRTCSGTTVSKNTISNTSGHAIYVYKKNSKSTVDGNTLSSPGENGVAVNSSSDITVKKNRIKGAKKEGIYATGSKSLSITENTLTSCKSGIYLKDSSGKSVSKNTVSKPKERGIYLNGKTSFLSLSQNYICAPGMTGIDLSGSAGVDLLCENRLDITSNKVHAIHVRSLAYAKKINSNKINCQTDKAGKKLKTACDTGIYIKTENAKTTQINSNTIKNCRTAIRYNKLAKKATVKSNKFSKCSTKIKIA